ncbi:MAG TPA: N-acetylmuramoyl-L-alanine amidase [Terriglobales bacterium]|nr:N-acetylmuramoyl-L-alanine amidase [Terriglobales bacterium]
MATSPNKPEFDPSESDGGAAPPMASDAAAPEPPARGRDALQALLAFSSLHEQIRQRRAREARSSGDTRSPYQQSPDEFVLYEVLQLVSERALALTGADGVAIALVQEGQIVCRAAAGPIAPDLGVRLDPNSGISGACFRTAEIIRCDDAENDPRVNVQASRRLNTRSMVAVPLCGRRSVVGMIEAFSTEVHGFNDSDVRSLSLLGELILGAMKPEEEERLESLSPVAIHVARPAYLPASPGSQAKPEKADVKPVSLPVAKPVAQPVAPPPALPEDLDSFAALLPPIAEVPLTLVQAPTKPARNVTSLRLVVALLAITIFLGLGLWWRLHSKTMASASAAPSASVQTASSVSAATENVPVPTTIDLPAPAPVSSEDASRNVLPLVTGVRHWESGDSTTVVIDLQDQVQYEVHRLTAPERIYFDLHDTVLGPGLSGKTIEVGDPLLLRIRVAQPVAGVSRIVLETKDVSTFSVSLETNPYRLVAEIRSAAVDTRPKAKIDFLHPESQTEHSKLNSAAQSMSKEDLRLRAHVPKMRIVVDAGHGGWDLGTVGRKGLLEKDLVLDIAQRLGDLLEGRLGSEIIYTRGFDTYIPLEKRAEIANEAQADLFVSVHANYSDYPSARGVETYYTNFSSPTNSLEIEKRENATANNIPTSTVLTGVALKERTEESRRLAASVERSLYATLAPKNPGIRDRGVKEAGFVVLTGTSMPAILAEVSFVSSPTDEDNLQSSSYRQRIAEALYKGIARYAANSSHVKMASASAKPSGR